MQIVLYTEKTVAQALTTLNARMQAKGTSTRLPLDGWVEKSGRFSVGVTTEVLGRFTRTTYLQGKLERSGSHTVINARVSQGATRENKIIIYGILGVIALALAASGSIWMAAVLIPVAGALYIPLTGDATNSELLVEELQKTLKARPTPPKPGTTSKSSATKTPAAKKAASATSRPAPAKAAPKPAPSAAPSLFGDEDDDAPITRIPIEEEV